MNISKPPIGALAALMTVALDLVWGGVEVGSTSTVAGVALVPALSATLFFVAATGVTLAQRYTENDGWGAALAKGFAMGVVAGVPYMFVGTAAGTALLGWAGLSALGRRKEPPIIEGEIVSGELPPKNP